MLNGRFDQLSERVIACAITVHRTLGPGLPESIYRECVALELVAADMHVDSECHLPVIYRGERVAGHLVLDLVVDQSLLIEVKAVERLAPVHVAQVITYLKITGYPVGLLMNFNATTLRAGPDDASTLIFLWLPSNGSSGRWTRAQKRTTIEINCLLGLCASP